MRQNFWANLLLILMIAGLPACVEARVNAPPTLKIGLVGPFEGLFRPLGYEALFGVKLALQERNRGDGVAGYRIELVALNDFDDPVEAEIQARTLAADPEVVGVIGHLSSVTTLAALPIYQEAQLPVVIPWSVAAEMADDRAGIVRIAANLAETRNELETISRERGFKSIEVIDNNLSALEYNKSDALYLATDGVTAGRILSALRQANISLPVLGQVDVGSPQILQVARAAANGLIFVSPGPDPKQVSRAETFMQAYQALAGFPPGPRAVLAYDAAQVLLDGIEQSLRISDNRPPTRAEMSATIKSVERQGLSGEIRFDRQGWRVNAPVWIYQIMDETYPGVLLTP